MSLKNFGFVLVLGALLPCLILGSPVSENDNTNEILFEEPGVVEEALAFALNDEYIPDEKEKIPSLANELYSDLLNLAKKLGLDSRNINFYLAKRMNMNTKRIEKLLQAEDRIEEYDDDDDDKPSDSSEKSLDAMTTVIDKMIEDLSFAKELNMNSKEVKHFLETEKLFDAPAEAPSKEFTNTVKELIQERLSSMEEEYLKAIKEAQRFKDLQKE